MQARSRAGRRTLHLSLHRSETLPNDPHRLLVTGGRVTCPRRGDTDIETCFVCGWMSASHLDEPQPNLRCDVHRGPFVLHRMAFWP